MIKCQNLTVAIAAVLFCGVLGNRSWGGVGRGVIYWVM